MKTSQNVSGTKVCSYCKEDLPRTEEYYYFSKRGFPKGKCRVCTQIAYYKRYHSKVDIPWSEYNRTNRANTTVHKRFLWDIKKKYSLTEQMFRDMMDQQKGCCSICGQSLVYPEYNRRNLVVDHCHTTGKVRGLLCSNCNTVLGHARDDVSILVRAANYLEENLL